MPAVIGSGLAAVGCAQLMSMDWVPRQNQGSCVPSAAVTSSFIARFWLLT